MPKTLLLILALTVIILTAVASLIYIGSNSNEVSKSTKETAINQAKFVYNQKKLLGEDFSNGPCLSNALLPGWVLDLVHNPRQKIDDLAGNQCSAYREGSAEHFVELDLDGNVVRIK